MKRLAWIASDVHLGAVPDSTERAFIAFLDRVGEEGGLLLLVGDLFDFWFEYGPVIPGKHFRTLSALAGLVDAGIPVTLVGGNHDAWGGRFLREEVGVAFQTDPFHMDLAGRRALVAHGDGVGRGDLKYRALKALLRGRLTIAGFRALHPELGLRIARAVSSTEAKQDEDAAARGRARHIQSWALDRLAEDPSLDLVVCGHAHLPALVEAGAGRWYINSGDWITHFSYVVVSAEGPPELRTWPRG